MFAYMKKICFLVLSLCALISCTQSKKEESNMDNPVIEAIMSRRSIRHYTEQPVEREKLLKIAQCGVNAPNAMNNQEWEVRIVDNQEYFTALTELMKKKMPQMIRTDDPGFRNAFRNATAAIFIASPADDPTGMLLQNVGLMSENICLAAQSLGLGTCIMGSPAMYMNSDPAAKPYLDKLGFSEGYRLQIVIAVGYPDEAPAAKARDYNKIEFVEHF